MTRRNILIFCLTLGFLFLGSLSSLHAQNPDKPQPVDKPQSTDEIPPELIGKIDPRLIKHLSQAENTLADVMIHMQAKADLQPAQRMPNRLAKRQAMITALQTTANLSQAGVRAMLDQAVSRQAASDVRSLWIVNRIAAKASWQTVLNLATRDDVALVRLPTTISLAPLTGDEVERTVPTVEWGVERINAPDVWHALGIDGTGIVIANLDSGVDYLHPDLRTRYRGYNGPNLPPLNAGNWYDTTGNEAQYPVDAAGHGTHTLGTTVGGNGIGVAPGAQWIAVKAFNNFGSADEVWLHEAFQWLLAPDGDPAKAPHIVNNSWSNNQGTFLAFEEDVQRLLDAGIIPVFSAGNNGPVKQSVGAPASYDIAFAVGATDEDDEVASFSGRGPSPWGKTKPEVSAPGVNVLSSTPGGGYQLANGTSMAAPHVAGTAALMLQADPSLTYQDIINSLIATAKPLTTTTPNNNSGWGLIDAYAAVRQVTNAGTVSGIVSDQAGGLPILDARLTFVARNGGQTSTTLVNETGQYEWAGTAGLYDVNASAFGYATQTQVGVEVITGSLTTQDFTLNRVPSGSLNGTITETGSGKPLSATITINGTPIVASSNQGTGTFNISLPPGTYTMTVVSPGYRVAHIPNIEIQISQSTVRNVVLDTAPTILLVDSGLWYDNSEISYFQQALDDTRYTYDTHRVKRVPQDVPVTSTLRAYDVVVWSSPFDSPGLIGASDVLTDYLNQQGNLFISGQDIAFFDGGGGFSPSPYYDDFLLAELANDDAGSHELEPVADQLLDGLSITISGGSGADNQTTPDEISAKDLDFVQPILTYVNQPKPGTLMAEPQQGGHQVGRCLNYRAVNLPFGLESISERTKRADILGRALAWFEAGPTTDSFDVLPLQGQEISAAGSTVTHTFQLRNLAETGPADTYTFSIENQTWPVNFPHSNVTLAPCEFAHLAFTVNIPSGAELNIQDVVTITAQSTRVPSLQTLFTRTTKTPAPVLLVDDDRWFNYEAKYAQALDAKRIHYDYWPVNNSLEKSGPTLDVLRNYPIVIWYNGFDWFSPISEEEEAELQAYLDQGGRLLLSSQEYLYKLPDHQATPFAQNYMGVFTHSEILSSTVAIGVPDNPLGSGLGPYDLSFPPGYNNWTDSITPTTSASAAFYSQDGFANAVTNIGTSQETWHTTFFAFGLELLNDDDLAELLNRAVGWLSWLGTSTITADATAATDGDEITYTAILRNDGAQAINRAVYTATLPYPLALLPGSATNGATESNGDVIWQGAIAKGESKTFTYGAKVVDNVPFGTLSKQVNLIHLQDQDLLFSRNVDIPINAPDWGTSNLTTMPDPLALGDTLTYTLALTNTGFGSAPVVTVTAAIPPYVQVLTSSIAQSTGSSDLSQLADDLIIWQAPVAIDQSIVMTYAAELVAIPFPFTLTTVFTADDGFRSDNVWQSHIAVVPYTWYLPVIRR